MVTAASNFLALLSQGLACMARHASGGSVAHVVPGATLADGHDVVSVHLPAVIHSAAIHALPVAGVKHGNPPSLVGLVAIATGSCIGPAGIVPPGRRAQPHWAMGRDALGHAQLLNITTPVTPLAAVWPATSFTNSTPNASSGR